MILLLGATGFIGQAFATEMRRRGLHFILLTRQALDYTCFEFLFDYVRKMKPEFIINAAGYVGKSDEESCESEHQETLFANTVLPQKIARVCLMTNTPWGHVSSGNIYVGSKILRGQEQWVERDLSKSGVRDLFDLYPERFVGFSERDEPNFSFRSAPCTFYSGTKALAEEAIRDGEETYIWRPALPFSERDEPRNYLSKIQRCSKLHDSINSFSHVEDFVRACLDLWERRAPYGIYNISNPGAVTTRQLAEMIQRTINQEYSFDLWRDDEEFFRLESKELHPSYILDTSKLQAAGVKMRPLQAALESSLRRWRTLAPLSENGWSQPKMRKFLDCRAHV